MSTIPYTVEQLVRLQKRVDIVHAEAVVKLSEAKWALSTLVEALEGPLAYVYGDGQQAERRLHEARMWADHAHAEAIRTLSTLMPFAEKSEKP